MVEAIPTVSQAHPINEAVAELEHDHDREDPYPRGLVMVIGGIGGLDWCGIALRRLLKNRQPRYTIHVFPWGLGFGRWHADLTNIINRDAQARLIAETIRLKPIGKNPKQQMARQVRGGTPTEHRAPMGLKIADVEVT